MSLTKLNVPYKPTLCILMMISEHVAQHRESTNLRQVLGTSPKFGGKQLAACTLLWLNLKRKIATVSKNFSLDLQLKHLGETKKS